MVGLPRAPEGRLLQAISGLQRVNASLEGPPLGHAGVSGFLVHKRVGGHQPGVVYSQGQQLIDFSHSNVECTISWTICHS